MGNTDLEPAGVGARCLSECLMLQIPPERELAKTIVKNNLEDIASNKIQKIAKDYGVTPEQVSDEIAYIKSLNPKPGMSFAGDVATKFVVPDAKIEFHNDRLIVLMNNDNIRIYMNSMYTSLATSEHRSRQVCNGADELCQLAHEKHRTETVYDSAHPFRHRR